MVKRIFYKIAPLIIVIVLAHLSISSANVLVTPTRIVLTDDSPNATYTAVNRSQDTKIVTVEWRQLQMLPSGRLERVDNNAPGSASGLVSVSPQRMRLGPGERQLIRVRRRAIPDLPQGEYISHLTFVPRSAPKEPSSNDDESESGTLGLDLQVNLVISTPVIVRRGTVQASANLSVAGLSQDPAGFSVSIKRTGLASTYGNIEIYWSKDGQDPSLIALKNGFRSIRMFPNG